MSFTLNDLKQNNPKIFWPAIASFVLKKSQFCLFELNIKQVFK